MTPSLDLLTVAPTGGAPLAFGLPGGLEWVIVGFIALLIFGSRLPHVARSMGDALREFKKGVKEGSDDASVGELGESQNGSRQADRLEEGRAATDAGPSAKAPEEFRVPYGDPSRPADDQR